MKSNILCLLLAALLPTAGWSTPATPTLQLTLKPTLHDGIAHAMQVELCIDPAGRALPALVIPRKLGPLLHLDERIEGLVARDDLGVLPLVEGDGEMLEGLGGVPHGWKPARATQGEVVIHYRAVVSHDTIPGPTWELRSQDRGISAAGWAFLVLPEDARDYRVQLHWDLSAYPADASALDSLPHDDGVVPLSALRSTYFMAGRLLREPADPAASGPYRSASTAQSTKFSQTELLAWSELAYRKLSGFFGEPQLPPFTVMFRNNTLTSKSGTALPGALMATMGVDADCDNVKNLLSHEMVHVFLHGLEPESWFQEGLAMVYQDRAPFALGLFDGDTYLRSVNETLLTYYSNVRWNMPMSEAQAAFWTDARARLQPYNRGALYFMVTDGRLRRASHGKRTLDDALREFLQRRREHKPVAAADWVQLLSRDLGAQAQLDYDAMRQGKRLVPDDGAFGICFERR